MIKKYNQYIKESLLDELKGPTEEELIKVFKDEPLLLLKHSINNSFVKATKKALNDIDNKELSKISFSSIDTLSELLHYSNEDIIDFFKKMNNGDDDFIFYLKDYALSRNNINLLSYVLNNSKNFYNDMNILKELFYNNYSMFISLIKNVNYDKIIFLFKEFIKKGYIENIKKLVNLNILDLKKYGNVLIKYANDYEEYYIEKYLKEQIKK